MMRTRPLFRSLSPLVSNDLWPTVYKGSRARGQLRVSVMTEEAANLAAAAMKFEAHPNRSVLEIFPGPGQLTRSMYLAGAKNIVTVENGDIFQSSLKKLEEESEGKIKNYNINPLSDPFDDLLGPKTNAIPDLIPQEWENIQSNVLLVGTIPNSTLGEKCLHDLLMASSEKMGIFKYGRVEMFMFMFKDASKRLIAPPGTPSRNRVSVLAEAAAEMTQLMRPGAAHFHLPYDYELVRLVPHKIPKLDVSMEVFDFCLRSLFTNKSNPLNKVIKLLGPGAEILLKRLSFDHSIKIKHMTLEQLNEVALKFEQWPLRPTVLYDDMILHEHKKKR
ncbi:Dimethyladenosine transferase 2, mitochondrial [Linnemannia gamsii]|uniref:rRNA adenine N(6)-methyltransferase n=1 Tax=Linnemannia gamsii TaxID=64522 RepID=A0A9P6UW22_9FUNG|nr:Dimethyladenosine transferase 2, mitochondrial [Linnemannia gamsii]